MVVGHRRRLDDRRHVVAAGNRLGHEPRHQQPGDRGVAVREVEGEAALPERLLVGQAEAVEADAAGARRLERRGGVDALVVASALAEEERQRVGAHPGVRQQELLVADPLEQRQLLLDGLAVQVVGVLAVEPRQVAPGGVAERRLGEELGPRRPAGAGHQAILAEVFLVEERPGAELVLLEQRAVLELGVARHVDAQVDEQLLGHVAVGIRRGHAHRAAVGQIGAALVDELVALGVAAEVVVVVEDEHALVGQRLVPEVGRRQARTARRRRRPGRRSRLVSVSIDG